MRQFIELLKMQKYDISHIYNEVDSDNCLESEFRTKKLFNQEQFTQFYKIVTLENQQPILILDKSITIQDNKPYYIIPSLEYHKWINAFMIKSTFPLLCFGAQASICRWTPKNHIHYPIGFRNRVYMVMKGVFSKMKIIICVGCIY